ncbi:hypothetical protein [Sorangium sp. So ce1024]|uniref:hypothetical protein n=1 Tax=unclassified Sorangium TaxID=2621164 RepID=UPI003F0ACF05
MSRVLSWIDTLFFGVRRTFAAGVELPERPALNFVGAVVTDNPAENRADVFIRGAWLVSPAVTGTYTARPGEFVRVDAHDGVLPSTLFDGRAIQLCDGVLGIPNHVKALRPPPAVPLRGSLDTAGDPQREATARSGGGSARTRAHHRRWRPPIHFDQVSRTYAPLPSKNRIAEGLLPIRYCAR